MENFTQKETRASKSLFVDFSLVLGQLFLRSLSSFLSISEVAVENKEEFDQGA